MLAMLWSGSAVQTNRLAVLPCSAMKQWMAACRSSMHALVDDAQV
jgi:hypothetical protein